MPNFQEFLLYLLFILPGLSKDLRNEAVEKFESLANLIKELGTFLRSDLHQNLKPSNPGTIIRSETIHDSFENTFVGIGNVFKVMTTTLENHASSIARRIEQNDDLRPWKMFGFIFQLVFLAVFAIADIGQVVNNIAPLFPIDLSNLPPILQDLTISILMSSVGIAIAAGFILAEFGKITHFGGWDNLTGKLRKVVIIILWFSVISIVIIDALLALSRIRTIPDVAAILSVEASNFIILSSAISSSLVIIPMILMTLLFLQGFVGFAIIYILLISFLALLIGLIHLVVLGAIKLLTHGLTYIGELLVNIILWLLVAIVYILGLFLIAIGTSLVTIIEVLQSLLNIAYFPLDILFGWIRGRFA